MDMVLEAFLINGWIDIAKTKSSSSLDPLFVKRSAINELSSKKVIRAPFYIDLSFRTVIYLLFIIPLSFHIGVQLNLNAERMSRLNRFEQEVEEEIQEEIEIEQIQTSDENEFEVDFLECEKRHVFYC